jgi:hypothetical protein
MRWLTALKGLKRSYIFHSPVTDDEAPDYSTTITNPMDFATIKHKIEDGVCTEGGQGCGGRCR